MHEPERSRIAATRSDAYEPVARSESDSCEPVGRWENEGGACDERELISLTAQMATGEPMNEASSP
jgi:hypothetical protein